MTEDDKKDMEDLAKACDVTLNLLTASVLFRKKLRHANLALRREVGDLSLRLGRAHSRAVAAEAEVALLRREQTALQALRDSMTEAHGDISRRLLAPKQDGYCITGEEVERLASIEERVRNASEGPWEALVSEGAPLCVLQVADEDGDGCGMICENGEALDMEFIADARQDVPWLLDLVSRLSWAFRPEKEETT